MHHPTNRIVHTTAFVTPVVTHWLDREIDQWVNHEGSIHRPILWLTKKKEKRREKQQNNMQKKIYLRKQFKCFI